MLVRVRSAISLTVGAHQKKFPKFGTKRLTIGRLAKTMGVEKAGVIWYIDTVSKQKG